MGKQLGPWLVGPVDEKDRLGEWGYAKLERAAVWVELLWGKERARVGGVCLGCWPNPAAELLCDCSLALLSERSAPW